MVIFEYSYYPNVEERMKGWVKETKTLFPDRVVARQIKTNETCIIIRGDSDGGKETP